MLSGFTFFRCARKGAFMLARSGKVSMATKKRSGEEINDRQILCGMGIKLRRLTAGICLITQLAFPMAAAAQGVVNAATQQPVPAPYCHCKCQYGALHPWSAGIGPKRCRTFRYFGG
ncbi:hypothetical protein HMPREF1592_03018 [Escherichia coli 907357]|nr:hypothetical protein HMPREF1592_03018 [Escherichia coli 907357]